jgi:hypothetical protein
MLQEAEQAPVKPQQHDNAQSTCLMAGALGLATGRCGYCYRPEEALQTTLCRCKIALASRFPLRRLHGAQSA